MYEPTWMKKIVIGLNASRYIPAVNIYVRKKKDRRTADRTPLFIFLFLICIPNDLIIGKTTHLHLVISCKLLVTDCRQKMSVHFMKVKILYFCLALIIFWDSSSKRIFILIVIIMTLTCKQLNSSFGL